MEKSTKQVVDYLKRYIGCKMIRTKRTEKNWDGSYTDHAIIFEGFTSGGLIKFRYTGFEAKVFGTKVRTLPLDFTDRNWITYEKALRAGGSELNKWKGKRVRRIRPTEIIGDRSYMDGEPPTLVFASKHHVMIMSNEPWCKGKTMLLRCDFAKPEDWELAED